MGILRKKIKIAGPEKEKEVEAIIDIASSYSAIPKILAEELGIKELFKRKVPVPPNGKEAEVPIGAGTVSVNGCSRASIFYILDGNVLLGQPELQSFDAEIDWKKETIRIRQCSPLI